MNNKFFVALLNLLLVIVPSSAKTFEIINSFASAIMVNADGSMRVEETITYANKGLLGLHGIYRDFPTHYKDRWGSSVDVKFQVQEILRDGQPVPYKVVSHANGKRIYIGDPEKTVSPGTYIYTIVYTTNRELGFFKDHDELYWNVTGNGWKFPIVRATAQVTLPEVPADVIEVEGYTGYQGEQGQDYTAHVTPEGISEFAITRRMDAGQGLTIVVSWPKGYVQEPTFWTKVGWFFSDNKGILWLFLGLLFLITLCIHALLRFNRTQRSYTGTVIPLFYPPEGLSASEVRYINRKGFDTKAFAAEIVDMAVHGLLKIESKQGFWQDNYTLIQQPESNHPQDKAQLLHAKLASALFSEGSTLAITQSQYRPIQSSLAALRQFLVSGLSHFLYADRGALGKSIIISVVFAGIGFFIIPETSESALAWLIVALYIIINVILGFSLSGYTKEGTHLNEQIEGFKLFLGTTETERLKVIGTPPTKTPELYETYLPYAIALDVEEQWSAQFVPIFEKFAQEGHPYVPLWYVGTRPFSTRELQGFSSRLSSSLSNVIAASSTPPGSSSGRGGRGSSGGGGGGGGGGSW